MFQRLGWILSLLLTSLTVHADITPGSVPVNMTVSPQGQVMVDFPIGLPKLASGLSPNLGIAYHENYSSAILGRSFSLNGFPYIHRCLDTLEDAGHISTFERGKSSYCLDGGVLISDSEGSRTYTKRIDDNSVVKLIGDIEEPSSWTVKTQDGLEYTYKKEDTNYSFNNKPKTRWLLASIKQLTLGATNQTIEFSYDDESYYVKPTKVTYGNVEVEFNYDDNGFTESRYRIGKKFIDSERLSSIEVSRASVNLATHTVNYEQATEQSYRLKSVTSCYNDESTCLQPSEVEYFIQDVISDVKNSKSIILEKSANISSDLPNLGSYTTGDVNGNGITDFCTYSVESGGIICGERDEPFTLRSHSSDAAADLSYIKNFYSSGSNQGDYEAALKRYGSEIQGLNSLKLIDLNNDGFDDYCYNRLEYIDEEYKLKFYCGLNDQSGSFLPSYLNQEPLADNGDLNSSYEVFVLSENYLDLNNDGFIDVCFDHGNKDASVSFNGLCYLNDKSGVFKETNAFFESEAHSTRAIYKERELSNRFKGRFIDLNNDGKLDHCRRGYYAINCRLAVSSDSELGYSLTNVISIKLGVLAFGDYDRRNPSSSEAAIFHEMSETLEFYDVNNDQLPDICYVNTAGITCHLNNGNGAFEAEVNYSISNIFSDIKNNETNYDEETIRVFKSTFAIQDVDGDGFADVCWLDAISYMCAFGYEGGFLEAEEIAGLQMSMDVVLSLEQRKAKKKSFFNKVGNAFKGSGETKYFLSDENRLAFGPINIINDTNADGRNELCYRSGEGLECIDIARPHLNRIKATVDSLGLRKSVRYKSTLNTDVYSNEAGLKLAPSDRYRIINPVAEVVSSLYFDNGHDDVTDDLLSVGMNETQFKYSAYSQNLDGYSPGFLKVEESNLVSNLRLTQHYYNDSKLIGQLARVDEFETQTATPKLFMQTNYTVQAVANGSTGHFRQLQRKLVEQLDVNTRTPFATQTVTYSEFDSYNYPKRIIDVSSGLLTSDTRTITNAIIYDHKANLRLLGLRSQELTTIASSIAEETLYPATKNVFDEYGRLTQQVKTIHTSESINTNYAGKLTADYSNFDQYGQAQTIANTGKNSADSNASDVTRTITRKYNSKGLLEFEANDNQHKTSYFYEGNDGLRCQQPTRVTDANTRPTQIGYDDLCRQNKVINFDGSSISYDWQWDTGLNRGLTAFQGLFLNTPSVYRITETEQLKDQRTSGEVNSQKITYLDRFERQLRNITIGNHDKAACSDGAEDIFVDYAYDHMGRTNGITKPYGGCFAGGSNTNTQVWQATHYDGHGRLTSEVKQTENGDSVMTYQYAGNQTTVKLQGDDEKIITRSIHGEPLAVNSPAGDMLFSRNGMGLVTKVTRNDLATTIGYDDYGNKISMNDPDMGTWSYGYNGFSELAQQADANDKETILSYDSLGRLTDKVFDGSSWQWEYDPVGEKGALDYHLTNEGIKRQYQYDELGRVELDTLTVNSESYETGFIYDDANRVTDEIQPSGVTVHRDYDLMGRLLRVSMPKGAVKGYNLEVIEKAITYLNSSINTLRSEVASNVAAAKSYAAEAKRLQTHALNLSNISNVDLDTLAHLNRQVDSALVVKEAAEKRLNESQKQLDTMRNRGMDHFVAIAQDNVGTIKLQHTKSYRRHESNGSKTGKYADAGDVLLIDTATREGRAALEASKVRGNQCYIYFKKIVSWGKVGYDKKSNCQAGIHPVNYYTHLTNALIILNTVNDISFREKDTDYKNKKSALQNRISDSQEAMAQAKTAYDLWRTNSLNFQAKQEELWASLNSRDELTALKGELKDLDSQGNVMLWAATRYRSDGQLQSEQFGNGYRTQREFYPLSNRISRITTQLTQPIRDVEYNYDNRGNLVTKTGHVLNTVEDYGYTDNNGPDRLTAWSWQQIGNADVQPITRSYSYNQYGGMAIDKGDNLVFDAASHRVDKVQKNDGTSVDYQYDNNGNLKNNGLGLNIEWNAFNKPASISSSTTTSFTYQAGGQRVVKEIDNSASSVEKTVYINPGLELVEKNDSRGNNISHIWRHHIRVGNDVVATIEKSSDANKQDVADKVAFIHRDLLGNPETITDIHGNTLQVASVDGVKSSHRLYSPYGELLGYISETDEVLAVDTGGIELAGTYRESLEAKTAATQKVADLADLVSARQRTIQSSTTLSASLTYTTLEEQAQEVIDKKARADAARQAATTYIFIGGSIPIIIPLVDESKIPSPETDAPRVSITSDLAGVANSFNAVAGNINTVNGKIITEEIKERARLDESEGAGWKSVDAGSRNLGTYTTANANVATQTVHTSFAGYQAFTHKVEFTSVEKAQHQGSIAGGLRGFTSHETLAEHGLVHMNARIYDPKNGRFLSADTLIPNPNNWDSYNRYMYVEGNPMRYRDPSGHNGVPLTDDASRNANIGKNDGAQQLANSNLNNAQVIGSGTGSVTSISSVPVTAHSNTAGMGGNSSSNSAYDYLGDAPDITNFSEQGLDTSWNGTRSIRETKYQLLRLFEGLLPSMSAGVGIFRMTLLTKGPLTVSKGLAGNPMFKNALGQFKNTDMTNVGRALTKHPEVVGATKQNLRQGLRTDAALNNAGANALKNIMRSGVQSTSTLPRYGSVTTFQLEGGFGARFYSSTKEFIGFINP